jgi:hypothetical protein
MVPTPDAPTRKVVVPARLAVRAAALCAVLLATSAAAYVLPSWSILRRMAGAREELNLSALRVDGSAIFFGTAAREAAAAMGQPADRSEVQVDGAVMIKVPNRCRFELNPVEGAKAASVLTDAKPRREGRELAPLDQAIETLCEVLAARPGEEGQAREQVTQYLKANKVETATTSLARFSGQVAYVLGNPAEGSAQFWVYKDSFLPARMLLEDKGVKWDVRFIDFTSPVTGEAFPRLVEVHRNGELALRFTALKSDSRATLADKLF